MSTKIIKGHELASLIKLNTKTKVINLKRSRMPQLAIIMVGNDYASEIYVTHKIKACQELGFLTKKVTFPEQVEYQSIIASINSLNNNPDVDGILVQLPLPKHLDQLLILNSIAVQKDVDGLTNINAGKLLQGDVSAILPCTVKAILELLAYYQITVLGKNILIINNSNIIGKPLAMCLSNKGAIVSIINKNITDINPFLQHADIICTAVGVNNLFTPKQVKQGVVIIDIAITRSQVNNKVVGDINYHEFIPVAALVTPVPGGIGPLTIAMLLENLVILFAKNTAQ